MSTERRFAVDKYLQEEASLKANAEIREALKRESIYMWQLAAAWGCCEQTAIKRFRFELPAAEKEKVFALIERIKAERGNA